MRYFIPKELNTAVVQANIFKAGYYWWSTGTTDVKSTHCENLVLTTESSADEFGLSVEQGLIKAFSEYKLQPLVTTRFQRNTKEIPKKYQRNTEEIPKKYQRY